MAEQPVAARAELAAANTVSSWLQALLSGLRIVAGTPAGQAILAEIRTVADGWLKAHIPRTISKGTDAVINAAFIAAEATDIDQAVAALTAGERAKADAILAAFTPYARAQWAVNVAERQFGARSPQADAARQARSAAKTVYEAALAGAV